MDGSDFVSFPQSGTKSPESPQSFLNIYDRVRSAATQVLSSLLPEDTFAPDAEPRDGPNAASSPPMLSTQRDLAPPTLLLSRGPSPKSSMIPISGSNVSTAPQSRSASVYHGPVNFIRGHSHSRRNSVATVGISTESAGDASSTTTMPLDVNSGSRSSTPGPQDIQQFPNYSSPGMDMSDVDSLFSVGTPSLSRAHLANHYNRSRQRSAGSLSRNFWMKDENASTCFHCSKPFTTFRRRHHCRVCGQIFCSSCTELLPGSRFRQRGRVRCCKDCINNLNSQYQSSSDEGELSSSLAPMEYEPRASSASFTGPNSTGSLYDEAPSELGQPISDPQQQAGSPTASSSRARRDSFGGVGFPGVASTVDGGMPTLSFPLIGPPQPNGALLENPPMHPLPPLSLEPDEDNEQLQNNAMVLGTPTGFLRPRSNTNRSGRDGVWPPLLDAPPRDSASLSRAGSTVKFPSTSMASSVELNSASIKYAGLFLDQILKDSELDLDVWHSTLANLLLKLTTGSHVELLNRDRLDPGQWIKLKSIPGGDARDIASVNGIVFTHNVALKSMAQQLDHPRILLISFPIEYSRGGDSYMSLSPVLAQEEEYLRKLVARITELKPSMLLSSSRISGSALEMLDAAGIVVATNVRELALERLGRYTKTEVLTSADRLSMSPYLGHANSFEVRVYRYKQSAKAFMFFIGLPEGTGTTILVRGPEESLSSVKIVLRIMLEVVFSLKLETSLMRDQFVSIPDLVGHPVILSSSPFTNYGKPYLLKLNERYEDDVVNLTKQLSEIMAQKVIISKASLQIKAKSPLLPTTDPEKQLTASVPEIKADKELETPEGSGSAAVSIKEMQSQDNGGDETAPPPDVIALAAQEQEAGVEAAKSKALEIAEEFGLVDMKLPGGPNALMDMAYAIQSGKVDKAYNLWMDVKHQWELTETQNPYMFNPSSHQNLVLTFALFNPDSVACSGPDSLFIEFYLDTDVSLGQYVETAIQTYTNPCPDGCSYLLGKHKRLYYHGNGVLSVTVSEHPSEIEGLEQSIIMWSQCKVCGKSTPRIPMSPSTWKYSFGKYLELSFWGEPLSLRADTCKHNIYRDHVRHFGWLNKAVSVEYKEIELYDVSLPDLTISWNVADLVRMKDDAYREISQRIRRFWSTLIDNLNNVKVEGLNDETLRESQELLREFKDKAEKERKACLLELNEISVGTEPTDYLSLNGALHFAQDMVYEWHEAFDRFDGLFFPTEPEIRRVTAQQLRGLFSDEEKIDNDRQSEDGKNDKLDHAGDTPNLEKSDTTTTEPDPVRGPASPEKSRQPANGLEPLADLHASVNSLAVPVKADLSPAQGGEESPSTPPSKIQEPPRTPISEVSPSVRVKSKFGNEINLPISPLQDNIASTPTRENKVSILARHFEEISREFELERQRERDRLFARQRLHALRPTRPTADVFQDVQDAVQVGWDNIDDDASNADSEPSNNPSTAISPRLRTVEENAGKDGSPSNMDAIDSGNEQPPSRDGPGSSGPPVAERRSLIKSLVSFWAERSSTRWGGIEYVLSQGEYVFRDSLVVIRDNEPSSLIAFCLSLPDYEKRISDIYSPSGDEPVSVEQVLLKQTGVHMRYQFAQGQTKLACKIFFGEQFDALRRQCKCDYYVQSLSRCSPWESRGGKSGSSFLKTTDNRMIIKELSQPEFDALATFLPSYFEYMSQALFHDLPTALGKIFGIYQLNVYSPNSTRNVKGYVLVMENLFYGREFTRFFDLKGSMRNRKVAETGEANEVLLDENMVEYIYEKPMYVRDHYKKILRASLYNDTLFLTKMNVMDYSLVLGIDETGKQITAGIIDFIRTFTWDKKIESWVKGRTTGGIKEPTVISPKQYKVRFRESMERYFLLVPDCWIQVAAPVPTQEA